MRTRQASQASRRHLSFTIEPLEARRLLASFALADYFPTKPGYSWDFQGNQNGDNASASRQVIADTTAGATVRLQDTIAFGASSELTSRFLSVTADGVSLVREDQNTGTTTSSIKFLTPLHLLNSPIQDGDLLTWTNVPITAVLDDPDLGQINGSGFDSGSSRVSIAKNVQLPDGVFIPTALKVVLDHTENLTGQVQGVTGTLTAHIIESFFLAPGIGPVGLNGRIVATISAEGESETTTVEYGFVLQSSPLLPTFDADIDVNGILQVKGTSGKDRIAVVATQGQIWVSNGAPTKSFPPSPILGIEVSALEGNDTITINAGSFGAYVDAGPGDDRVTGGDGKDTFTGGAGKDVIYGGNNDDRLNGNGSLDQLFGESGNDRLYGGDANDQLDGGGGVDRLFAGLGDDLLIGGGSNDKMYGDEGKDTFYGGAGADLIDGGPQVDSAKNDPLDMRVSIAVIIP